ncbi:MAG: glutathione S-transferase [Pacificimonas sp.]
MGYDFWYWPGIPGRGEFVRIALEAGGIAYKERGRDSDADIMGQRNGYEHTPPYAPPWLDTGDLVIAQTTNILLYLGEEHGLAPKDRKGRLWTNQLMLTIMDMVTEAHDTHHPVTAGADYEDQKQAALGAADAFRADRMPKFFTHFQKALGDRPFFNGDKWSYADLGFFVLMRGLCHAFPKRMAAVEPDHVPLFAHRDRMAGLDALTAYLASDRCLPFGNGLFRHYPELDAPD